MTATDFRQAPKIIGAKNSVIIINSEKIKSKRKITNSINLKNISLVRGCQEIKKRVLQEKPSNRVLIGLDPASGWC